MRRKTRVTKAEAAKARGTTQRKTVTLIASVEVPKNAHVMVEQFQRMYKARKKAVTLRLDADVLARFKRQGRAIRRGSIRRCGGVMWEGGNRGSKGQGFWVCGGRRQEWKCPPQAKIGLEWATGPKPVLGNKTADAPFRRARYRLNRVAD